MTTILTIGHSTHSIDNFIALLRSSEVTVVADVRSSPFSRYNPQFNLEPLKQSLRRTGIGYVFLGKELGARCDDPNCYVHGRVQYARLALRPQFRAGLDRVAAGADCHRVALMCAEKDPITCHRTILVARHLIARGFEIEHISTDGSIETNAAAINRLIDELKISRGDLFSPTPNVVEKAYEQQEARIAYVSPELSPEPLRKFA